MLVVATSKRHRSRSVPPVWTRPFLVACLTSWRTRGCVSVPGLDVHNQSPKRKRGSCRRQPSMNWTLACASGSDWMFACVWRSGCATCSGCHQNQSHALTLRLLVVGVKRGVANVQVLAYKYHDCPSALGRKQGRLARRCATTPFHLDRAQAGGRIGWPISSEVGNANVSPIRVPHG